jgi:hypothetical protein
MFAGVVNSMKAVVMEIYKDYCIVMTKDGQFLKQEIPAGVFEIGDEIMVSEGYVYKPKVVKVGWMRSFAVGTMIVVMVAVVSIFGVWYLKQYRPSRDIALLTEDTTEETLTVQIEEEAPQEEIEEESALSMNAEQEEKVIFDSTYSLEEEAQVEEDINGIIFSYEIIDNVNLRVKLENKSYTPSFNGTFNLVMLFSDGSESRIETIPLEGFEPGKVRERPFFLKAGETDLRLIVTEITY